MATRIYTKTGDEGETGLVGGRRVRKDDLRVEAYGTVDELNACLGQARATLLGDDGPLATTLGEIQALLLELGAELATPAGERAPAGLTDNDVTWLEQHIDASERELLPLRSFILPGGSAAAGALHLARAVCRRAERRVVALRESEPATRLLAVVFLNRLGDLLFVLARVANRRAGRDDVVWHARSRLPATP